MNNDTNYLNLQINVLWFALIFVIFVAYIWLRTLSKRTKDTASQLEELKSKTVVNEVKLNLQKRSKR